jgi:hypothetical protein
MPKGDVSGRLASRHGEAPTDKEFCSSTSQSAHTHGPTPLPNGDQFAPSYLAIRFALKSPILRKLPPTYRSFPFTASVRTEKESLTPLLNACQKNPFHRSIVASLPASRKDESDMDAQRAGGQFQIGDLIFQSGARGGCPSQRDNGRKTLRLNGPWWEGMDECDRLRGRYYFLVQLPPVGGPAVIHVTSPPGSLKGDCAAMGDGEF